MDSTFTSIFIVSLPTCLFVRPHTTVVEYRLNVEKKKPISKMPVVQVIAVFDLEFPRSVF